MIRLLLIVFLTVMNVTTARSAGWIRQWVCADDSCRESQLWFLRTICLPHKPSEAFINATSNGRITIYVNGYNTTTDVLAPYHSGEETLHCVTCNALPFIANDTCIIAVWYSPFLKGQDQKQLSLTLYGKYTNGESFAFSTDNNWWGTLAPATTLHSPYETESINSRAMIANWNIDGLPMPRLLPVKTTTSTDFVSEYRPQHIRKTYTCRLADSSPTSLTYLSPFAFRGWARVTLRGMKPGTQITVNGLYYTCSGQMDEQACRRFTISPFKTTTIKITSPSGIKESNVMSVEAMDIW